MSELELDAIKAVVRSLADDRDALVADVERLRAAVQRAWETLRIWRDEREMEPQTARLLYEVGAALDGGETDE